MQPENLLDLVKKQGIKNAEVYQVESYSRPICFSANRLKQIESSQVSGIALRLWRDNKPGLALAYGEFDANDLIAKALAISDLNDPEEIFLNDANNLIYSNYDVSSERFIDQDKKIIKEGEDAIASILDLYPEAIVNLDVEWERETATLINTQGLYCQQKDISQSASLGLELVREEDFLGIYDGEYSHGHINLTRIIESVLRRLEWAEKNVAIKTGKIPVLFTPNAVVTLWDTVTEALNGKYILDKSSPWSESLGKTVISPCLTLKQQPDLKPYDCPFDDEGSMTQNLTLIEAGVLKSFYTDKKTASKLGINNTGNGFRGGLGAYPSPDLVNLVISEGNKSFPEIVKDMNYGIIVDQILGGGADISGDFSFNIDLGYLVDNGEIQGRIKDTMLAGNVYQCLQEVIAIASDIVWSGACYTPSIVIDNLSVVSDS